MGYRNDVAIAMRVKDYDAFSDKALASKFSEDIINLLGSAIIRKRANYVIFQWECIKWDPLFEGAEKWIEDNLPPIHKFVRIGQDYDDIQVNFNTYDPNMNEEDLDIAAKYLHIRRDIKVDLW